MSAGFRSVPPSFQDRAEGTILLCLGGLMAALANSRHYWNFLNPRFSPLTLGAGVALCVCGLALLLRPEPGRGTASRLLRQAALLGFLCLAATAWDQAASELPPGVATSPDLPSAQPAPPKESVAPRVTRDGTEYLRLNLAELYIMLDKGRTDYPRRFVLRAHVTRPAALGGAALLSRIAVTCCLADSLDLGFVARGLDGVQDGQWAEVYGRLEPLDAAGKKAAKAAGAGCELSLRVVNPGQRIVAEHAEVIPTPDPPFLFEFREQEPFAWQ